MKPYTYLLRHKPTGMVYYGVRWAKGCDPSEFWKTYFTSSKKQVPLLRKLYGDDSFEFEIRRTFLTAEEACSWEKKVLTRMKVLKKPDLWLNRSIGKRILNDPNELSARMKGKPAWNKGKKLTDKQTIKMRKPKTIKVNMGKYSRTESTLVKISEIRKTWWDKLSPEERIQKSNRLSELNSNRTNESRIRQAESLRKTHAAKKANASLNS